MGVGFVVSVRLEFAQLVLFSFMEVLTKVSECPCVLKQRIGELTVFQHK